MAEEYVSREEFNNLKDEVQEFKKTMLTKTENNQRLLQEIDKKIDVISEKIKNADQVDDLKLKSLSEKVTNLEDSKKWIVRTLAGTIAGIVIKIFFDVSKLIN